MTTGFHWTASEEQMAAAARKAGYTVVFARDEKKRLAGASDQDFVTLSQFDRLDAIARDDEAKLRKLIEATYSFPPDLQELAGIAIERLCTGARLARFEIATLTSLSVLDRPDLPDKASQAARTRVLGGKSASIADLMQVFDIADPRSHRKPLSAADQKRFDALWKAAVERDEFTLEQWVYALNRSAIDRATFKRRVIGAFRRAVAAGFVNEKGFGDLSGFSEGAGVVAAAEPDLALQGLVALSTHFNENGLRELLPQANVLPKKGYSKGALAAAGAHFSQPAQRSAAKIFGKLLAERGIAIRTTKPPVLESIDVKTEVGTDVATLVIGSFEAVEQITAAEDPDDWAGLVRKTKSLGVATGGDGTYAVRIIGAASGARADAEVKSGAVRLGVAPLAVKDDALTISGVVGAGGTPTFPFPSGTYAAHVLVPKARGNSLTVVIHKAAKVPAWPFGKKDELPLLGK